MLSFWKRRPANDCEAEKDVCDLLAQREELDFAESVQRKRVSQEAVEHPIECEKQSDSEEIEWEEQQDVYRPTPTRAAEFVRLLELSDPPSVRQGVPLCFIRRAAWEIVQSHLREDTSIELGGLLVGQAYFDIEMALFITVVEQALPAREGEGTALTFSYTENTWRTLSPQLDSLPAEWTLLGSYHSHPGLGVFLSSTDLDTQRGVFSHDWQIALVADPLSGAAGIFFGAEGHPCKQWQVL